MVKAGVCGGDEAEKDDGEENFSHRDLAGQELDHQDGEKGGLDHQDQDQCHSLDDFGLQHPSGSFFPGFLMILNFSIFVCFWIISASNQRFLGGRLSHCWTLRPGCLS